MTESIKKALTGSDPSSASPANGIQSKAVCKYTEFIEYLFSVHPEILICTGVEAFSK